MEAMSPLVSVIVPLYNRKDFISRCVASVSNQTYANWELIIVDDGSTDEPGAVLDALQAADTRIRVIHQPNGGVSSARNTGMDAARGDYVQFLDSDDELLPTALEYTVGQMLSAQADVVAFCFERQDSSRAGESESAEPSVMVHPLDFFHALMQDGLLCGPVNKLWKRSLIGESRFSHDVSCGEDFIFNLTVLRNLQKGVYVSRRLYRVHEDAASSLSRRFDPKGFSDVLAQARAVDSLLEVVKSYELEQLFFIYLWSCYTHCVRKLCMGIGLSYCQKVELLRSWNDHPRIVGLYPYAPWIPTLVSWLLQHRVITPIPMVQFWVIRKSRVAELLRQWKRNIVSRHVAMQEQ